MTRNVSGTAAEQFDLWLMCALAMLAGAVGVLSAGFFHPDWGLRAARRLARNRIGRAA